MLVTGAGGYIGGRLVGTLDSRGVEVRAVSRHTRPWLRGVDQRALDLSTDPLDGLLDGVAGVVHLAGPHEVYASRDPDHALATTIVGTRRLARDAADAGIGTFVYLSTVHVYGAALGPGATITEGTVPQPRHPYAIARLGSEYVATSILDATVFRLTNAVGAPADPAVDRWSLVTNDLCRQAVRDGALTLTSDGTAWRDFVPLTDVCAVLSDAVLDGRPRGTFNLASGHPLTVMAIAEMVQRAAREMLGSAPAITAAPPSGPAPEPYTVSTDKLCSVGVRPAGRLEDAIEETMRFCIERKDDLPGA